MSESIKFKRKIYEISEEVEQIAQDVIKNKNLMLSPAQIKYVKVYPLINKTTAARCILSNPMMKLFGKCDYVVQVSGELWDMLDDNRKKILIYHELLHVFIQSNKKGGWDFKLRNHDIKEFYAIIKEHGIDWFNDIKTLFSSVYGIDPDKLDGFGL